MYLSIHPSIYLAVYLSTHFSLYLSIPILCTHFWPQRTGFQFTVEPLCWRGRHDKKINGMILILIDSHTTRYIWECGMITIQFGKMTR